jgi:hypothetical protein
MVFLVKTDSYQKNKKCDTNKNVTKIGVITKGIYYTTKRQNIGPKIGWRQGDFQISPIALTFQLHTNWRIEQGLQSQTRAQTPIVGYI